MNSLGQINNILKVDGSGIIHYSEIIQEAKKKRGKSDENNTELSNVLSNDITS